MVVTVVQGMAINIYIYTYTLSLRGATFIDYPSSRVTGHHLVAISSGIVVSTGQYNRMSDSSEGQAVGVTVSRTEN